MRSHVASGTAVVEELIRDFDLGGSVHVAMLRNIVRAHHEALDGSGYPHGLKEAEIPLEARIVAVADVFDALTTRTPLQENLVSGRGLRVPERAEGHAVRRACVAALVAHAPEVESIRGGNVDAR